MGIFGSASSKMVDEFAKGLARELAQQCPPEPAPNGGKPVATPKKFVATLEEIYRKALGFKVQHGLGIYKKARLGNTFRWELTTLGYDKAFAEDLTQRLVLHLSRKS
jgi:hypothetical protein